MEFERILEFCETEEELQDEDIRSRLPRSLQEAPERYKPYEESLQKLDADTWKYVKERLLERIRRHPLRGWAQFYETLAEVRGYNYLSDNGYQDVNFIPETNNMRTPDVEAVTAEGNPALLESKSISFSDEEREYILENTERQRSGQPLQTREVIQGMPDGLKNKIRNTVENAKIQLADYRSDEENLKKIVFLTIQLDIQMYLDPRNFAEVKNFLNGIIRDENEVYVIIDDELSGI